MYTSQMRMTGLSGIDTESMIKQLMQAESMKLYSLQKNKQKTQWQQEAYRALGTNLKTFQNNFLDNTGSKQINLRSKENYVNTATSITSDGQDTNAIKIKNPSEVKNGGFSLKVDSIAKADRYEGSNEIRQSVTGTSSFSASSITAGDSFNISLDGGRTETITFTADDIDGKTDAEVIDALNKKLKDAFGDENGNQKVGATINGEGKVSISTSAGHSAKLSESSGALLALGIEAKDGAVSTSFDTSQRLDSLFGDAFPDGEDSISFSINGVDFSFDRSDSVEQMMKKVNESKAGVTMSFDNIRSSFSIESNNTGTRNAIKFGDDDGFLSNSLGIDTTKATVAASDAVFEYNGFKTTRETNDFEIDGIKISLTKESEGKDFNVKVSQDSGKTMDTIKTFVEEYNKLIDMLTGAYNTPRPKSGSYNYYEPLTDDEKKAMSEKDIELWEEKAKTGILYRDDITKNIHSQLRSMMYQKVTLSDGSSLALYDIGITTANDGEYTGKLKIDEQKLAKAIEENGDKVAELFTTGSSASSPIAEQGIVERVNTAIENAIGSKGSIYKKAGVEHSSLSHSTNDLYKSIRDQDEAISNMLKNLQNKENYYYQMFSKLEVAMTQSNNQMNSLYGLLGM